MPEHPVLIVSAAPFAFFRNAWNSAASIHRFMGGPSGIELMRTVPSGGIALPTVVAASATTPPAGMVTIFIDSVTGGIRFKDSAAALHSCTFTTP